MPKLVIAGSGKNYWKWMIAKKNSNFVVGDSSE